MHYARTQFVDTAVTPSSDDKISWSPKYRGKHPLNNVSGDSSEDDRDGHHNVSRDVRAIERGWKVSQVWPKSTGSSALRTKHLRPAIAAKLPIPPSRPTRTPWATCAQAYACRGDRRRELVMALHACFIMRKSPGWISSLVPHPQEPSASRTSCPGCWRRSLQWQLWEPNGCGAKRRITICIPFSKISERTRKNAKRRLSPE